MSYDYNNKSLKGGYVISRKIGSGNMNLLLLICHYGQQEEYAVFGIKNCEILKYEF